jgi:molybdopterin-guanine dinucleotide biosynthesis protein A
MGEDKALLTWGTTDLLGHALARLGRVADEVRILGGATRRYRDRGVPVHEDPRPDLGPLGGLLAALEAATGDRLLLLGVDLPLVPTALLADLVSRVGPVDAVVPCSHRGPEPLCAVYGPACRPAVRCAVGEGRLKMTSFWPEVRVREVPPAEIADFGDPDVLFLNVNGPGDYERARRLAG